MEIILPWQQDTERAEELTQERARALTRINLAEEGRSEAAERRTKALQGRENPIACPGLAGERSVRLCFGRIQCKRDRSEQIKGVKLWSDERRRVASGQHRLQGRARRSGHMSGSLVAVMM